MTSDLSEQQLQQQQRVRSHDGKQASGGKEGESGIKKQTIETSKGDVRLWVEILRNLTKDIPKHHCTHLPDSVLSAIRTYHSSDELSSGAHRSTTLVAFSCGHAYSIDQFQNAILSEFVERVQGFPLPIPVTLKQLQAHYKHGQRYPSACPHCVFQFLRKFQMEACPQTPIKPWNI